MDFVDFDAPTVQWCYSPEGDAPDDASALTQSRPMVVRRLAEARDRPQSSGMLRPALEAQLRDTDDAARRAWATALAVVWLDLHASDWRGEWQLLAAKAHRWLAAQPPAVGRADRLERAREVLAD